MSIRRLMATAGGLVMTLALGQPSPLRAQETVSVEADANVIRDITARNLLEIRLGEVAQKRTTQPNVRGFADRMIADHSMMHRQWSAVVGKDGNPFKPTLGQMRLAEVTQLERVPVAEFDKQYMALMVRHHQDNAQFLRNASRSARSAQVRQLMASDLPIVEQHLNMALQVGAAPAVATGPAVPADLPPSNPNYPGSQNPNQPPPTTTQNPPAPTQNPPAPTANAPVSNENAQWGREDLKKDRKFINNAIADNTLEIRLAQLVQNRSTQNSVRQLAKRIQDDHTALQNQWISMGARNGMNLKAGMGPRHRAKVERLEKFSGTEFDRAYATMQIQSHQDYVEYFAKEGRATNAAQVRNLAANELPILQRHLNDAKQVGSQLGVDIAAALRARHTPAYRNQ